VLAVIKIYEHSLPQYLDIFSVPSFLWNMQRLWWPLPDVSQWNAGGEDEMCWTMLTWILPAFYIEMRRWLFFVESKLSFWTVSSLNCCNLPEISLMQFYDGKCCIQLLIILVFTACHKSCASCSGPSDRNCLSCGPGSGLYRGQCLPQCPITYFRDINGKCKGNGKVSLIVNFWV